MERDKIEEVEKEWESEPKEVNKKATHNLYDVIK